MLGWDALQKKKKKGLNNEQFNYLMEFIDLSKGKTIVAGPEELKIREHGGKDKYK